MGLKDNQRGNSVHVARFKALLALKQATSSRLFGVNNRAAANGNERVAGVTLS